MHEFKWTGVWDRCPLRSLPASNTHPTRLQFPSTHCHPRVECGGAFRVWPSSIWLAAPGPCVRDGLMSTNPFIVSIAAFPTPSGISMRITVKMTKLVCTYVLDHEGDVIFTLSTGNTSSATWDGSSVPPSPGSRTPKNADIVRETIEEFTLSDHELELIQANSSMLSQQRTRNAELSLAQPATAVPRQLSGSPRAEQQDEPASQGSTSEAR